MVWGISGILGCKEIWTQLYPSFVRDGCTCKTSTALHHEQGLEMACSALEENAAATLPCCALFVWVGLDVLGAGGGAACGCWLDTSTGGDRMEPQLEAQVPLPPTGLRKSPTLEKPVRGVSVLVALVL